MARVSIRNVVKRFGNVEVVHGLSLDIAHNEFVVLVGPSGCGKSTTLRMIAGLEDITDGEIFIGGDVVNDVPPKDRDIAMVFQNYALYPHMTVYENMSFGLRLKRYPKDEIARRVTETISEVAKLPKEAVWVVFEAVTADDWYVGEKRVSELQKKAAQSGAKS